MTSMNGATEAPNKFGSELRRAVLSSCVLALLSTGEHYGFDLVRSLSENYGMATQEGTVYPLLTRLKDAGYLAYRWEESRSGPPRKYYRITDQGADVLAAFVREWSQFSANVNGLLNSTGVST